MTIRDLFRAALQRARLADIPGAPPSLERLFAHILDVERAALPLHLDTPAQPHTLKSLESGIDLICSGTPLEYITHQLDFYGLSLRITESVLIPRQETELLVERLPEKGRVWDICCGSGCIGLAYKKRFPHSRVILSDICEEALAIARENAAPLDVELCLGDLLAPFAGEQADLVVSNPPYISEADYAELDPLVHREPKRALVAGETGLEIYDRLSRELPPHLVPGGALYCEIGSGQGEMLRTLFREAGWASCHIERDYAGHDRFLMAIHKEAICSDL